MFLGVNKFIKNYSSTTNVANQNFLYCKNLKVAVVQYSYLIVDDDAEYPAQILNLFESYPDFFCVGIATGHEDAINKILDLQPDIVILEPGGKQSKNGLSFSVITDLYQYIDNLPHFIIHTDSTKHAYDAIRAGADDYIVKPLNAIDLRKSILKFKKAFLKSKVINTVDDAKSDETICIKSYSDYQFISLNDIVYLKADNNTTDFYLNNGRKLTAYKTLKHYETSLPINFSRIHNSYIVNINYISRINLGKSLCYLSNSDISISFSKTFKDNIEAIIRRIAPGNI
jgi:two-component system, LytTR family, response regulator